MSKPSKVSALTEQTITKAEQALDKLNEYEKEIDERVGYIIKTIYSTFGMQVDYHLYGTQSEYNDEYASTLWTELFNGGIWGSKNHKTIKFSVSFKKSPKSAPDCIILTEDGKKIDLTNDFPIRWLTEEFEDELAEGKKRRDDKDNEHAEAKKAEKIATESLVKKARAKLTNDELKALMNEDEEEDDLDDLGE